VNLDLNEGESIAIIGRSGSGKSTLLHILSGLLKPNSGTVQQTHSSLRNDIGIVFQAHYLFRGFSALENLQVASLLSDREIDSELLQNLKIEDLMSQKVTELSGGQQQRISVGRVLTKEPKIIFADEPTGNLDSETARDVMDTLLNYIEKNSAGLLLVTHDVELAHRCNRVYRLENGELLEER
jgi:putative ABC transport system ATP-binding protein